MKYEDWLLQQRGWDGIAARALREKRDGLDREFLRDHNDQSDAEYFEEKDDETTVIHLLEHEGQLPDKQIEAWIVRATAEELIESTTTIGQDEFLTNIIERCKDAPLHAKFAFSERQFRWFSHLVKTSSKPCTLMRRKLDRGV